MRKYIFFDLDDTLIITQPEYNNITNKTTELVKKLINSDLVSTDIILQKHKEIDFKNVSLYGLSKKRFPTSWVETYEVLSKMVGKEIKSEDIQLVNDTASQIFTNIIPLYEEAHSVLRTLKGLNYELYILTAGDNEIQNKRVDDAQIRGYFSDVYIVPSKNPEVMSEILSGKDKESCIMIGNSLRSDIYPALSNGIKAIHLVRDTWEYDQYEIDKNNRNYRAINNLSEVPRILNSINAIAM